MIFTKRYQTDHIQKLELALNKLKEKGIKYFIENYFFGQTEIEYLGFSVTHNGIKLINRKIETITNMKIPTSRREVQQFIGAVNYYRNMWPRRPHTLAPLTIIISNKRKSKWNKIEQDEFNKIKRIMDCNTLLTYPDPNEKLKFKPILAPSN